MNSFLTVKEISEIGFKSFGKNVLISRNAKFYSPEKISIASNVRIDDFCVLSGKISIGNYVHVAVFSAIFGDREGVEIGDFCNISSRVSVYAVSDDFSGSSLTSPVIPEEYKHLKRERVVLEKHTVLGSGCVVLPGAYVAEGCAFGALSLIKRKTEAWKIYAGVPCRVIGDRKKDVLKLEKELIKSQKGCFDD